AKIVVYLRIGVITRRRHVRRFCSTPLEFVVSALNKFLVRARALRSTAASKTAKLAKTSSTNLSRIAFLGLIALVFMSSTESMRVARPRLTANIEIVRTRPIPAQTTPSSSVSDSKLAPTPYQPEAAQQPVKPAKH